MYSSPIVQVVMILGFHPRDPGSTPGRGTFCFCFFLRTQGIEPTVLQTSPGIPHKKSFCWNSYQLFFFFQQDSTSFRKSDGLKNSSCQSFVVRRKFRSVSFPESKKEKRTADRTCSCAIWKSNAWGKKLEVLPGLEPGSVDSESTVITITL